MIDGFVEFEFDLPGALLARLIAVFDQMESAPLLPEYVQDIPEAQGVYQLLLGDEVVYIGKTDAQAGLAQRLRRHAFTIRHRQNLTAADVKFKAVRVYVFTAMDLETQLIRHYGSTAWNNSGFGSNDPGRNRDDTELKPTSFDALYPIDLDQIIPFDSNTATTAAAALAQLRSILPYTLRFQTSLNPRGAHPDLIAAPILESLPATITTRTALLAILKSLPPGWQATALAGRIILYKEDKAYRFGVVIGRSGSLS